MTKVSDIRERLTKDDLGSLRGRLTDQQIADRFRTSISTVRKLAHEYQLPHRQNPTRKGKYRDKELDKRADQFEDVILLVSIETGEVLVNRLAEHR